MEETDFSVEAGTAALAAAARWRRGRDRRRGLALAFDK